MVEPARRLAGHLWRCLDGDALAAVYGPTAGLLGHQQPSGKIDVGGGGWVGTVAGRPFRRRSPVATGDADTKTTKSRMEVIAAVAPFVFIAGLLIGVATFSTGHLHQLGRVAGEWPRPPDSSRASPWSCRRSCIAALLVMAARVDINEFSLNAFYRNRLVRCYLGATRFAPTSAILRTSPASTMGTTSSCASSPRTAPQRGRFTS